MNRAELIGAVRQHWHATLEGLSDLPYQARSVVYGAAVVSALATLVALANIFGWWISSASEINSTKPLIGRLLGYIDAAPAIEASLAEVDEVLSRVAIADTGESGRGGALLQQQLRQLAAESGLAVIGSELGEPEQLQRLVKLRVTLNLSGAPESFDEFFSLLHEASPMLFVYGANMEALRRINRRLRSEATQGKADYINARVDVSAYRLSAKDIE